MNLILKTKRTGNKKCASRLTRALLLPLIFLCLILSTFSLSAAKSPQPTYGTAHVDGNIDEWNLTNDFFAPMWIAGDQTKTQASSVYLRYDCSTQTMYVLVSQSNSIPLYNPRGNAWGANSSASVGIVNKNNKIYDDSGVGSFAWVNSGYDGNSTHAQGYEASFKLVPGDYRFVFHVEAWDSSATASSATAGFQTDSIGLEVLVQCSHARSTATQTATNSPTTLSTGSQMNFYVFLPLLARGSSSISPPPDTSNDGFHYGVLDPQGIIGVGTDFANWINSVRAYGMNDGFVYNDNPDFSVSDALGFNVLTSPMFQMYREWYYYENYHNGAPLCGGTLTMACAEAQIGPIVNALKGHSSLVGYDTIDDTSSSMKVRVWYANQIFHAHDTLHPEGPTLIGTAYQDVYDYSRPDNFIVYDYPARQGYAPCDFYRGSSQNWVDNLRFAMQLKPSTVPLIEILQTHATSNWLRYPTVEELRLNYWLALGEGTKGLYWFTWSTIPGDYWMGLSKNTTLLPEAADLVSRTTKLRPYLAPIHKIADAFQVSAPGKSYISTLKNDATGILYVIAANHECAAQTLTLSSWNYNAQIKDLETGQIYKLPASISFRGGDGKLFQVVNPASLTPPTPQANLILNSSFEQSSNGTWPDNWSTPIVGSGGSTGTVTWDSTVSHTGSHSIKFVGSTNNGPYFSQTPSLNAGTRYYLSYWVKGQNLALTNNSLGIRLIETGATCCGVFIDAWWNQSGAFDWQKHIAFFRVPVDYTQGRLDIVWNLQAGATAWLDDVTLCQVDLPCPDTYLGNR